MTSKLTPTDDEPVVLPAPAPAMREGRHEQRLRQVLANLLSAAGRVRAVRSRRLVPVARGGGNGLGLAIVHAVTAAHVGTVNVTSRPGETRFTITLPVSRDI